MGIYKCSKYMKSTMYGREDYAKEIQKRMILSFTELIEKRDANTGKHAKRTGIYVRILANELKEQGIYNIDEEYVEMISRTAPLHDIGKIAISDTILNKQGRLTQEEFEKIKEHPLIGIEMLEKIIYNIGENEYLSFAYDMVLSHHEKWDGSGYPRGIAGENIPLSARIMAVADVFDALVSKRCYKEACSYEQAFEIIGNSSGTHFDPVLVSAFLNRKEELESAGEMQEHFALHTFSKKSVIK